MSVSESLTFEGRFSLAPEKAVRLRVEWICTEVPPAIEIVLRTAASDFL
ncbi:MAG: hypothetical protein ISN28_16125 [Ectothiorhodospiraceae bacterium AqS1]|nr:hypothetical protein [Ectothiorhodospiraceae bacterium AqS1]